MEFGAIIALTVLIGALVILVAVAIGRQKRESSEQDEQKKDSDSSVEENAVKAPAKKQKQQQRPRKERQQQHTFSHQLLASSLKSHNGNVTCLDFSSNGKYLASCSDDRTVRIWSTKDFLDRDHKCLRANVEFDHATRVRFSPDSRAFITWLASGETIRIYKMIKKDDGTFTFKAAPEDFPQRHKGMVLNIGIAETGKFIMSASIDTTILIWDLKGDVLATINTNQMTSSHAAISPCGRFVAACGFTPDVKVWEVCFTKSGEFKEVVRAFDLKGHSAGVYSFDFSNDSRRMVTVSKDGTWKLWDTDVEYKKKQDPYLLRTVPCQVSEGSRIALSQDGRVVAVSSGCDIAMYNAVTGELEEEFHGVHSEEITDLKFDINNRFLVSTGDRAIRVFHNVIGYRAAGGHSDPVSQWDCHIVAMAKLFESIGKLGLALAIGGGVVNSALFNVDAGHRAVIFDRFRGVQDVVVGEGTHFLIPWVQKPIIFDCRSRPRNVPVITGSKDLQNVNITLRILFRPLATQLPRIFTSIGEDYDERVLPSITTEVLKAVVARFDAGELITQRELVSRQVSEDLTERASTFGLILDDVSLTHLTFGKEFTEAVEMKQVAQQEAERARFVVEKAEQQKQAAIISAAGDSQAALLIANSLAEAGDGLVELRKLEAAEDIAFQLSRSRNVTYLPSGQGTLLQLPQ